MEDKNTVKQGFDLKWWQTLDAQQKLTVGMAAIILVLSGTCVYLFKQLENNKVEADKKNESIRQQHIIEVTKEKARGDACYESQILYLKVNEEKWQKLFFETERLKEKINENNTD